MRSSRFIGVLPTGRKRGPKRWTARINHNGRKCHLGTYDDEEDAARAYDKMAREIGRPEASLNFPRGQHTASAIADSASLESDDAPAPSRRRVAKRPRAPEPSSEDVSGAREASEDERSAGAAQELSPSPTPPPLPPPVDWAAEAERASQSLPRLRELMQMAELRAAMRDGRRASSAADAASAASHLSALWASDAREAVPSARLRTLLQRRCSAEALLARRSEAAEAARMAEEAAAEAAALKAQADARAAEIAGDGSTAETEPMDA